MASAGPRADGVSVSAAVPTTATGWSFACGDSGGTPGSRGGCRGGRSGWPLAISADKPHLVEPASVIVHPPAVPGNCELSSG